MLDGTLLQHNISEVSERYYHRKDMIQDINKTNDSK